MDKIIKAVVICAAVQAIAIAPSRGRKLPSFLDMVSNATVFKENFHMKPDKFKELFLLVEPLMIQKRDNRPLETITSPGKFTVVVEHLASVYRNSKQHSGSILNQVCSVICETLSDEIPILKKTEFVRISSEFNTLWSLPNCLEETDAKLIAINCPPNSGSLFYNYKGFHSIILVTISDASYKFVYIDVSTYGSEKDANVFSSTQLRQDILEDKLEFPGDVKDGWMAFPRKKSTMKPCVPKKPKNLEDDGFVANYRISRARGCVEPLLKFCA